MATITSIHSNIRGRRGSAEEVHRVCSLYDFIKINSKKRKKACGNKNHSLTSKNITVKHLCTSYVHGCDTTSHHVSKYNVIYLQKTTRRQIDATIYFVCCNISAVAWVWFAQFSRCNRILLSPIFLEWQMHQIYIKYMIGNELDDERSNDDDDDEK